MEPIRIVVDSRVRLDARTLSERLHQELRREFTYKNPEFAYKKAIGVPVWNVPPDIRTWQLNGDELSFARGCYRRVREILDAAGVSHTLSDERTEGGVCRAWPRYTGPALRYYQEAGIDAAIRKQNCIVRAPTGSGKSLMAIAYAARLGLNTLVILPTVALFKQWTKDALRALDMRESDLGIIHGAKRKLRPLTVAVQGTLASRGIDEELQAFFGVVIVDECQKAAASTYIDAVDPFPAKYRLGVSADERRKDRKEFLTRDLFADVAYEIDRKKLETEGHVLDVEIRVVPTDFEAPWFGVATGNASDNKEGVNFSRLLDEMTSDPDRNELAIRMATTELEAGEQVIVLSHRREHCQALDRAFVEREIRSGFLIGGQDYAREFDATRNGIEEGNIRVGIGTYGALGYGVNLPAVSAGVAVTPIGSNKQSFNQVRGRLCRQSAGKSSARLYVLWDRFVYPTHLQNITAWNPTVKVLEGSKWIEAQAWMRRNKEATRRTG